MMITSGPLKDAKDGAIKMCCHISLKWRIWKYQDIRILVCIALSSGSSSPPSDIRDLSLF